MTLQEAIEQCRTWLEAKYSKYWSLSSAERRLLCMAYLADQLKVRESGSNRGVWVEVFQTAAGISPGDPWCAAAVTFASLVAKAPCPQRPDDNPASVLGWRRWAAKLDKLVSAPTRGAIAMHRTSETRGHIAAVVRAIGLWVWTIEGNTGRGKEGSQRDGDGFYRRVRLKSWWNWGFADV